MSERFTLVTGRTREQAVGMHKGKGSNEYREATSIIEVNPDDLARLGVDDGALVRVRTTEGQVDLTARSADVPPHLVFVPMGTTINSLMGVDTQSTGMPSLKGIEVELSSPGSEKEER